MLLDITQDEADILATALERVLAGNGIDDDTRAHTELLRDDLLALGPHPGIVVDLSDPAGPRIVAGAHLRVPVAVIPPGGGAVAWQDRPRVDAACVARAMAAAATQAELAPVLALLARSLSDLEAVSVGVTADRAAAWSIVERLVRTLCAHIDEAAHGESQNEPQADASPLDP